MAFEKTVLVKNSFIVNILDLDFSIVLLGASQQSKAPGCAPLQRRFCPHFRYVFLCVAIIIIIGCFLPD